MEESISTVYSPIVPMARRKSTPKTKKVLRSFTVEIPSGNSYVDVMRELSKINRKLFRQGMVVGIENIEFGFNSNPNLYDTVWLTAAVAGDTWSVHNSWTKGKALWDEMQHLVLEDNPSIEGKWADFKVHLDSEQLDGTTLVAKDAAGADYIAGEWDISDFVIPQHDVDPATGLPLGDESMYYEYMDRSRTRAADRYRLREFHESTREMAENRIMNRLVRYRFLTVMVELFDTTSIQEYFD